MGSPAVWARPGRCLRVGSVGRFGGGAALQWASGAAGTWRGGVGGEALGVALTWGCGELRVTGSHAVWDRGQPGLRECGVGMLGASEHAVL